MLTQPLNKRQPKTTLKNWRKHLLPLWNFWPPFFGAGIRIQKVSDDFRFLKVVLKKRWWNSNYVGTQYGGSMFSLTDPFYMVMLLQNLGPKYIVWDKAASIDYVKPGKTHVFADFEITEEDLNLIKSEVEKNGKFLWTKHIEIKDLNNEVISRVHKTIYIRQKGQAK